MSLPLALPRDILDHCGLVPDGGHTLIADSVRDLLQCEDTTCVGAGPGICTSRESADSIGCIASWIRQGETASVLKRMVISLDVSKRDGKRTNPTETHHYFLRFDSSTPEKIQSRVNLGHIRMRCDIGTNEFGLGIPDSVQVVSHEVEPVDVGLNSSQVEVLQIPVGGRKCHGDTIATTWRKLDQEQGATRGDRTKSCLQLLYQ